MLQKMIEDLTGWLTEQEIADAVGVKQPTVNRWKTGDRKTTNHLIYPKVEALWKTEKKKSEKRRSRLS